MATGKEQERQPVLFITCPEGVVSAALVLRGKGSSRVWPLASGIEA
jgi:hypothetical protein